MPSSHANNGVRKSSRFAKAGKSGAVEPTRDERAQRRENRQKKRQEKEEKAAAVAIEQVTEKLNEEATQQKTLVLAGLNEVFEGWDDAMVKFISSESDVDGDTSKPEGDQVELVDGIGTLLSTGFPEEFLSQVDLTGLAGVDLSSFPMTFFAPVSSTSSDNASPSSSVSSDPSTPTVDDALVDEFFQCVSGSGQTGDIGVAPDPADVNSITSPVFDFPKLS